jgi:predicted NAD/FAD-binding protein
VRLAIVGSGISGLICAHVLGPHHDVVLYEADSRFGGHSHTVMVAEGSKTHAIDTGFIVHNDRNYPNLVRLFAELGMETVNSEMSFAVTDRPTGFTYRATNLNTIFADRKNVLRPTMWRMLADIVRFYRDANKYLDDPTLPEMSIGRFCEEKGYSNAFLQLHLVPMGAAVWSASPQTFDEFPARSLFYFLSNHGLLGVRDRPQWKTLAGGSRTYVEKILDLFEGESLTGTPVESIKRGQDVVTVSAGGQTRQFDHVVLACHSDQALRMLERASDAESSVLGAITYQPNTATLHTDTQLLSPKRSAWAAWNYEGLSDTDLVAPITYDLTNLQRLDTETHYLVSLNSLDRIDPSKVISSFEYAHPVFDAPAIQAQGRWAEISGTDRTHYCGAYWSYGFHEDGIQSGLKVCDSIGINWKHAQT